MKVAVLIVLVGALGGCATLTMDRQLVIEASGPWVAQIQNGSTSRTVEGTGAARIPRTKVPFCWSIQQKGEGRLKAYIPDPLLKEAHVGETTVPHGVVSGCA